MRFDLAAPSRIVFGDGVSAELPAVVTRHGSRVLWVTGSSEARHAAVRAALSERASVTAFSVPGEPTVELVERGLELARAAEVDVVVGIGGGSVLDAGKAIAALRTNPGSALDYLEVIGAGRALARPSLPYIAVPTTSGTGAEVTKNAVLGSGAHGVKVSLRSEFMLPAVALVDPELTHGVPPSVTASTGLDALTQLIEPFVSNARNPYTDALSREGIARSARSLRRAHRDGRDAEARRDLSLASLFGGLALANAKLGAVHGFAGPIGGMFPAPHGAVCARLLPWVIETNLRALGERAPDPELLGRYDEIARLLMGRADARAPDAVVWVHELCEALAIPGLASYGVETTHVDEIVTKASRASSMKGNPIVLTEGELREIVLRAL